MITLQYLKNRFLLLYPPFTHKMPDRNSDEIDHVLLTNLRIRRLWRKKEKLGDRINFYTEANSFIQIDGHPVDLGRHGELANDPETVKEEAMKVAHENNIDEEITVLWLEEEMARLQNNEVAIERLLRKINHITEQIEALWPFP